MKIGDICIRDELIQVLGSQQHQETQGSWWYKVFAPAQDQLRQKCKGVQEVLEGANGALNISDHEVIGLVERETTCHKQGKESHDESRDINDPMRSTSRQAGHIQGVLTISLTVLGDSIAGQGTEAKAHNHQDELMHLASPSTRKVETTQDQGQCQCDTTLQRHVLGTSLEGIIGEHSKGHSLHVVDEKHPAIWRQGTRREVRRCLCLQANGLLMNFWARFLANYHAIPTPQIEAQLLRMEFLKDPFHHLNLKKTKSNNKSQAEVAFETSRNLICKFSSESPKLQFQRLHGEINIGLRNETWRQGPTENNLVNMVNPGETTPKKGCSFRVP